MGPELKAGIVRLVHEKARVEGGVLVGGIPALDSQYGNVWTDIGETLFTGCAPRLGERFKVTITCGGKTVFSGEMPYVRTFGEVPEGQPLLYLNSLMDVSFALNLRSFAETYGIRPGAEWSVRIERAARPADAAVRAQP